jgi:hypothetical protein
MVVLVNRISSMVDVVRNTSNVISSSLPMDMFWDYHKAKDQRRHKSHRLDPMTVTVHRQPMRTHPELIGPCGKAETFALLTSVANGVPECGMWNWAAARCQCIGMGGTLRWLGRTDEIAMMAAPVGKANCSIDGMRHASLKCR